MRSWELKGKVSLKTWSVRQISSKDKSHADIKMNSKSSFQADQHGENLLHLFNKSRAFIKQT